MTSEMKNAWAAELEGCLRDNILPYWLEWMADPEGGFYGRRDGNDVLHPEADRGAGSTRVSSGRSRQPGARRAMTGI